MSKGGDGGRAGDPQSLLPRRKSDARDSCEKTVNQKLLKFVLTERRVQVSKLVRHLTDNQSFIIEKKSASDRGHDQFAY